MKKVNITGIVTYSVRSVNYKVLVALLLKAQGLQADSVEDYYYC